MARWSFANVLNVTPDSRKLWQFSPSNFNLARELTTRNGEVLPGKLVGKDWHSLWSPKLNIAWLPADKVFLRVLQLPVADFAETLSMVELQLEKISPLPVAQIVWTIEVLPKREESLQTVIVVVVPRNLVEEFLGQLEGQGYLADRIEVPILDQLLATQISEDGVWIYPGESSNSPCLVAWWYGGILRNLALLSWSEGVDANRLKEQLAQMAWSGELENWLTSPPRWHLVANEQTAAIWEPLLRDIAGEPVQVISSIAPQQLAALSARRAVRSQGNAGLLPSEFAERYKQQFVDRLWMRGILALFILYLVGVVIYFSALQVVNYQLFQVKKEVASISQQYTNTIQLKQRVQVLEEQSNLKFAALDAWKAASDLLPEGLTLNNFSFQKGETIMLSGTVAQENLGKLTDYYEAMTKATVNGMNLNPGPLSTPPASPGPNGVPTVRWSFNVKLEKDSK